MTPATPPERHQPHCYVSAVLDCHRPPILTLALCEGHRAFVLV